MRKRTPAQQRRMLEVVAEVKRDNARLGLDRIVADPERRPPGAALRSAERREPEPEPAAEIIGRTPEEQRYRTMLDREFLQLRRATADLDSQPAEFAPMRALEAEDEVPDPYALEDRLPTQRDIAPDFDPAYRPFGQPPDGYKLALALRTARAEHEKENAR